MDRFWKALGILCGTLLAFVGLVGGIGGCAIIMIQQQKFLLGGGVLLAGLVIAAIGMAIRSRAAE